MLCDSNILIYAAEPEDNLCKPCIEQKGAVIASVTRIEVLGFPGYAQLAPERQDRLREIIDSLLELTMDEEIIGRSIFLRQQKKMGLADAIIAATALEYKIPLVTRNSSDFKHIAGLEVINPFEAAV